MCLTALSVFIDRECFAKLVENLEEEVTQGMKGPRRKIRLGSRSETPAAQRAELISAFANFQPSERFSTSPCGRRRIKRKVNQKIWFQGKTDEKVQRDWQISGQDFLENVSYQSFAEIVRRQMFDCIIPVCFLVGLNDLMESAMATTCPFILTKIWLQSDSLVIVSQYVVIPIRIYHILHSVL